MGKVVLAIVPFGSGNNLGLGRCQHTRAAWYGFHFKRPYPDVPFRQSYACSWESRAKRNKNKTLRVAFRLRVGMSVVQHAS